ncbi:hypothetical protein RN001_012630 [Aquatica leii]|uniref:RecA family profile 1 domain-containing protein n=1 Tax=Aquatica leii TaxID=1421715 RepID=A0AAN7SMJ2_9COLE|nr:hypothetical protein RN001_012630 [Aquatica leii]
MSRLNPQMHPLLNSPVLEALLAKNIYTVLNFIETEIKHIVAITNLQYKEVLGIRKHLINKYAAVTRDGVSYYNEIITKSALFSTGIKRLDSILQGGFLTGNIYEICGLPASGKTQLNLTLVRNVAQNSILNVYYIDTKNDFSGRKLKAVLDASKTDEEHVKQIMSQILVKKVDTVHDLINTLYEIKNLLYTKTIKLRLIIIDSLPPLFYSISDFSKRYGLITTMVNVMHVLAKEFHTAIVVTNVLTTSYENTSTEDISGKIGLGKYWYNVPNTRLTIKKFENSSECSIIIAKSNRLLEGAQCNVKITDAGII